MVQWDVICNYSAPQVFVFVSSTNDASSQLTSLHLDIDIFLLYPSLSILSKRVCLATNDVGRSIGISGES